MMRVVDTGAAAAAENMSLAEGLLASLPNLKLPILHLFSWRSMACTYGVLVQPQELLDLEACRSLGVDVARRPTGGGVMFHVEDFSFSLVVPADHPRFSRQPDANYTWLNSAVARALNHVMGSDRAELASASVEAPNPRLARFCMAAPTRWDLLWEGRKVAGPALRITRKGLLYQISIALRSAPEELLTRCAKDDRLVEQMRAHGGSLLGDADQAALTELRERLRQALQISLSEALSPDPLPIQPVTQ